AANDRTEPRAAASANTRPAVERGAVARPVAQQRHRLNAKRRGDNFADLAFRQRAAGVVQDLQVQLLVVKMAAGTRLAFAERVGQFRDAVGGIGSGPPGLFDAPAGDVQSQPAISNRFADANRLADGASDQVEARLPGLLGDETQEGRDADDGGGLDPLDHLQDQRRGGGADPEDGAAQFAQ